MQWNKKRCLRKCLNDYRLCLNDWLDNRGCLDQWTNFTFPIHLTRIANCFLIKFKSFIIRVLQLFPMLHKNRVYSTIMNQIVDTVYINCNFEVQLLFASQNFRIYFMDYDFDAYFAILIILWLFVGKNECNAVL